MKILVAVPVMIIMLSCGGDKSSKNEVGNIESSLLCGEFHSEGAMYDVFIFDGNGEGTVSALGILGEFKYVQVNDTVYITPDQSQFTMLVLPDGKLQGFGEWLGDAVYERVAGDSTECSGGQDANQSDQQMSFQRIASKCIGEMTEDDLATLESLCDDKLSDACLALANVAMRGAVAKSILNTDMQDPDEEVLAYIQKAIDLGDSRGLTKMGEYYFILYDTARAKEYYSKACDQSEDLACIKMMEEGW